MKIGILTFHNALNYGAVLQAYATQQLLRSMGNDVEIIDYRNEYIENSYKIVPQLSLNAKNVLASVIATLFNHKKKRRFNHFTKHYLHLSKRKYTLLQKDVTDYDAILVGSDQVWNPKQTGGFDSFYWGNFPYHGKLVAWSASSKENAFDNIIERKLHDLLTNFDFISVREEHFKQIIDSYTEKKIYITADPTLLLSKQDWEKLCCPIKDTHYILVYAMQDEYLVVKKAREFSQKKGLPVIIINPYTNAKISKGYLQYVSPEEFLAYFKNADYTIVSSFHGTVFSIIFHKNFFCFIKEGSTNVRITSLLKEVNFENRIISESTRFNEDEIDFSKLHFSLDRFKNNATNFLNEIL